MEYTQVIGNYNPEYMRTVCDSLLIEASIMVPEGLPYDQETKKLHEFCLQLSS